MRRGTDVGDKMGIIPVCVRDIYSRIENITTRAFILRVSCLQVYNEN